MGSIVENDRAGCYILDTKQDLFLYCGARCTAVKKMACRATLVQKIPVRPYWLRS
jgi:hypothetical protein